MAALACQVSIPGYGKYKFMDRIAFRELLARYVNGTAAPEEKALVDHWYELLYDHKLPALKQEELDSIEQEMWTHLEKEGNMKRTVRRKRLYYFAAAAVVAGLITTAWALFSAAPKSGSWEQSRQENKLTESINNTTAPKRITLNDGSYVLLQPASKITYSTFDSSRREVYLEGEAFFSGSKRSGPAFLCIYQ